MRPSRSSASTPFCSAITGVSGFILADITPDESKALEAEAAAVGINWTFAPMIDIARDARWGRIAESFGEDPYLTAVLGAAAVAVAARPMARK